jgi:pimeloyl-ACP methyl ester carboxylesterase
VVQQAEEANRRLYAIVKSAKDSATAAAEMSALAEKMVASVPPQAQAQAAAQLKQAQAQLISPWMRYFLVHDPAPTLRQVHVPVLALNGTLDLQVPYKENLSAISAALTAAGNKDFKVVEMPGLNHLFQPATTGSPTEYQNIPETFSPAALDIIAAWISAHAGKK